MPVDEGPGRRDRRQPALIALVSVAVLAVLLLAGVAARSGSYAADLPPAPARSAPPAAATAPPAEQQSTQLPLPTPSAEPEPVNPVTGRIVLVVVLAAAAVALLLLLRLAVRYRPRLTRRAPDTDIRHEAGAGPGADPGAAIPEAVDRALAAVEQPDAREAVVRAWLLLGEAAAAAGTPARDAETATEYADRLAGAHGLPPASVHRLAALYREARFSGHPVDDGQRDRARAELTALRTALAPAARGPLR